MPSLRVAPFSLVLLLAASASAQSAPEAAGLGEISGTVTNAETGEPVMGAGVAIPDLGLGAVSQRDGSYVIEGVPVGTHAVRAAAYTYHFETVEVEVGGDVEVGDEDVALDFALHPGSAAGCASHDH